MDKRLSMDNFSNRIMLAVVLTAVLCMIGILMVCGFGGKEYRLTYMEKTTVELDHGWRLLSEDGREDFTLPIDYSCAYGKDIVIEKTLQQHTDWGNILKLQFLHLRVSVYLDDRLIYKSNQEELPFSHTPARTVHFVQLPEQYEGSVLRLVLTPCLKGTELYRISTPMLGSTLSLLGSMMHKEAWAAVGAVILIFAGFCIMLFSLFMRKLRFAAQIFYLGSFALIAGIFLFCETELALLLLRNSYLVHTGDAVALQLLCLPFLALLSVNCQAYFPRLIRWGTGFVVLNFAVQNICNFLGRDYRYFVTASHIGIVFAVFLVVSISIRAAQKKDRETLLYMLTFIPMALCAVPELLAFYWVDFPMQGFFFELGVFLFVFLQIRGISRRILDNYQQAARSQMFQEMALTDHMTKLGNRAAYQQQLDSLGSWDPDMNICCAMADVNHLKQVNDTLGHEKGDALIIETAQALKKIFAAQGHVYRIGGDEFAVILQGVSSEQMEHLKQQFKQEISRRDKANSFPVSAALGYAMFTCDDQNLEQTFVRADNQMYADKKAGKAY